MHIIKMLNHDAKPWYPHASELSRLKRIMDLTLGTAQKNSDLNNLIHHADTIMSTATSPDLWLSAYLIRDSIYYRLHGVAKGWYKLRRGDWDKSNPVEGIHAHSGSFAADMLCDRTSSPDAYCNRIGWSLRKHTCAPRTSLSAMLADLENNT